MPLQASQGTSEGPSPLLSLPHRGHRGARHELWVRLRRRAVGPRPRLGTRTWTDAATNAWPPTPRPSAFLDSLSPGASVPMCSICRWPSRLSAALSLECWPPRPSLCSSELVVGLPCFCPHASVDQFLVHRHNRSPLCLAPLATEGQVIFASGPSHGPPRTRLCSVCGACLLSSTQLA